MNVPANRRRTYRVPPDGKGVIPLNPPSIA
jgi:hypothetical protein